MLSHCPVNICNLMVAICKAVVWRNRAMFWHYGARFLNTSSEIGTQKPCSTRSSIVRALCCDSRCIIFSTYFAIRSASRFTGSPGFSECRLVISTVCGMMAMVQRL